MGFEKKASPHRVAARHARQKAKAKVTGKPSSAIHHDMTQGFSGDHSTTAAVRRRQSKAPWNLKGMTPPPMVFDRKGREIA